MILNDLKSISRAILFVTGSLLFTCCNSQDEPAAPAGSPGEGTLQTCLLAFEGAKPSYGQPSGQRKAAPGWTEGDKILLTFACGDDNVYGDAVYSGGTWTLNYYGSLKDYASGTCTAVYFENADFTSGSTVGLTEKTAIYEDGSGIFTWNGESLAVTASLSPKTGRVRFSGDNGASMKIAGMSHFTGYDSSTGKFATTDLAFDATVAGEYTDYIYGFFAEPDLQRISLITPASGFTKVLPASVFKPGASGVLSLPTPGSFAGWANNVALSVGGVDFTMIPVEKGEDSFFIAETETTEALWVAVMRDSTVPSRFPKVSKQKYQWEDFVKNLNSATGLKFSIPSLNKWQFAYQGGNKSACYKYAGSNTLEQVAWYKENAGGARHEVKGLQPNELGIYDMSGNVAECVSEHDLYWYGGYYNSTASDCLSTVYYYASASEGVGCRVALSFK